MAKIHGHKKNNLTEDILYSKKFPPQIIEILNELRRFSHNHNVCKYPQHLPDLPDIEELGLEEFTKDLDVILEKRTPEILYHLNTAFHKGKRLRFTELYHLVGDIGTTTLTERLRSLEQMGIVERKTYREIPPRVEYTLTERGCELLLIMALLFLWSKTKNTG